MHQKRKKIKINLLAYFTSFVFGVTLLLVSWLQDSSPLLILGISIIFWSLIFLYIKPEKKVSMDLLVALYDTSNIQRLLKEKKLANQGIYLPPKNLEKMESDLLLIPKDSNVELEGILDVTGKLYAKNNSGLTLTPPGQGLSKLIERELGVSSAKIDYEDLKNGLRTVLIEKLEICENIEFYEKDNSIKVQVSKNYLDIINKKKPSEDGVSEQIGCLLSSALACLLVKSLGKPIHISNQFKNEQKSITEITFQIRNN